MMHQYLPLPCDARCNPTPPVSKEPPLDYLTRRLTCYVATAVASFFTPTSQKPPEKIVWHERAPNENTPNTLLVGKYDLTKSHSASAAGSSLKEMKRRKVAAFDFVSHGPNFLEKHILTSVRHIGFYSHPNIIGEEVRLRCSRLEMVASISTRYSSKAILRRWVCCQFPVFKTLLIKKQVSSRGHQ